MNYEVTYWYICGLLSDASLWGVEREKTLATGENILIAVSTCKPSYRKGWEFTGTLEQQPNWKVVSIFEHHIPEHGLRASVCLF